MLKIFFKKLANNSVKLITRMCKRSNKIVVVGGWFGKRFSDNSKAMFLFLAQNKSELNLNKVIFITRSKEINKFLNSEGYISYLANSFKGMYFQLRSNVHIVDQGGFDLNAPLSAGAIKVNLWHGYPLKKIGYYTDLNVSSIEEAVKKRNAGENALVGDWNDCYYLAFSNNLATHIQYAFGVEKEKMLIGSYPRNVYMGQEIEKVFLPEEGKILDQIEKVKANNKKIIFYLPTFRDVKENNDRCLKDIVRLKEFLEENDIYLLSKLHFASYNKDEKVETGNHIINLPPESDVYNFLDKSDVLITDYSSIYFDYLLLNKPMIFYCFDLEYYENHDRGFLYNYNSFTPGPKADNLEELKSIIMECVFSPDRIITEYKETFSFVKETVYEGNVPSKKNLVKLYSEIAKR